MFPKTINNNNRHYADTVYSIGHSYIFWRLSVWSTDNAILNANVVGQSDRPHNAKRKALYRHPFPNAILFWQFLWSLRPTPCHPQNTNFPAPYVRRLVVQRDASAWSDQFSLWQIVPSVRALHGTGYIPKQFVGLFDVAIVDRLVDRYFASEFGPLHIHPRGGQCCTCI